eukprot:GGOE01014493.1.p1 GENE.GGOE01014493.1~~GGOE01014493.1.p1  ORF type:complete len:212 (+),score=54.59 GGOE01014493.1:75-710(+)
MPHSEVSLRPTASSVASALAALPPSSQRVALDFLARGLGDAEVEEIVSAVVRTCPQNSPLHICRLNLRHNSVTDAAAGHVAYLLEHLQPPPLVLDLGDNRLTTQGFACLTLALLACYRKKPMEMTIHLDRNDIDVEVARLVLETISADGLPSWCQVDPVASKVRSPRPLGCVLFRGLQRQRDVPLESGEGSPGQGEVEGEEIVFAPPVDVW